MIAQYLKWRTRVKQYPAESFTAQQHYKGLIDEAISPAMREFGLRGSGGRYAMPSDTHWILVGFQKSSYSDHVDIRFTVNLMVVARNKWETAIAERPYLGKKPSPLSGYGPWAPSARLGMLRSGIDEWWSLTPETDVEELADEVLSDFTRLGLPWLREHAAGLQES